MGPFLTRSHEHVGSNGNQGLLVALLLTLLILCLEIALGIASNSLALLSDAGHMLTDVLAIGLAWLALVRSRRPANERYTFGYRRSSILAALANAILLIVIAMILAFEAFSRLQHVPSINGGVVVIGAGVAILINLFITASLGRSAHDNLNLRAVALHVWGDTAASVGVVIGGLIILFTHTYVVDPVLSFLIAALIAVGSWRLVSQTLGILMEATPQGLNVGEISRAMQEVPGVEEVHDLHVWTLSDGYRLLSAHVIVPDQSLSSASTLIEDLRLLLSKRFTIGHSTIEIECRDCTVPVTRPIRMQQS